MSENATFRPARPWGWVIRVVQTYIRLVLAWRNRLHLEQRDLELLRELPQGAGIILVANHADETDFEVCLELSRRCGRRFFIMMNREAFAEGFGTAGWWLQRLGAFSVERGGQNDDAKRYAIEAVERGREVLVIFPEGEIYYLNDLVQPFKSGAVAIGMQAVVETRETRPDWTVYLIPMALKCRYHQPIAPILERRTRWMEQRLSRRMSGLSLQRRLADILSDLLHRQELAHHLKPDPDGLAEVSERVQEVRHAILAQVEEKYAGANVNPGARTMDRTWHLSSYLRDLLTRRGRSGRAGCDQVRTDLAALTSVGQMGSGSRSTRTWTRRRNDRRKWSSNWSAISTRPNARANLRSGTSSSASASRSTWESSSGPISRILRRSAVVSPNNSATRSRRSSIPSVTHRRTNPADRREELNVPCTGSMCCALLFSKSILKALELSP
jgi:1-acyl-sn-glycerol-3-phosphate acyltransferase